MSLLNCALQNSLQVETNNLQLLLEMCIAVVHCMQAKIKLKFSSTIIIISRWRFHKMLRNMQIFYLWLQGVSKVQVKITET